MAVKKTKRSKQLFKSLVFGKKGKGLQSFLLTEIILIFLIGILGYFELPIYIPIHYGMNGIPNGYGQSWLFPLLSIILVIAPIIVLLTVKYRFKLLNKYPYFINMPAFYFSEITRMKRDKRSYWVNKYFELILGAGVSIAGLMIVMIIGLLESSVNYFLSQDISILSILWILATIVIMFYYLRDLYKQVLNKDKVRSKVIN